jgi:hypothetical protein
MMKQGAELRVQNLHLPEHDYEIIDTEFGAAETVQRDKKKSNGIFQDASQSDEEEIEDE